MAARGGKATGRRKAKAVAGAKTTPKRAPARAKASAGAKPAPWEGIKTRFRAIGRMVREAIKRPQKLLGAAKKAGSKARKRRQK